MGISPRLWFFLGLIFVLVLAACGPSSAPTATPAPVSTRPPTPTLSPDAPPTPTPFYGNIGSIEWLEKKFPFPPPPPKGEPRNGGTVHLVAAAWSSLDPTKAAAAWVHANVYQTLFEQKLGWDYPELQYKPEYVNQLAETWEQKDPTTYIFNIRKGVKWHNVPPLNGRELVAEDVKYAFEKQMAGGYQAVKVTDIDKIEVLDKYTLKVTLKQPFAGFVQRIGDPVQPWVFPKEVSEAGKLQDDVIGTGAYVLKEIKRGEGWLLERNSDYWEKDEKGRKLPYMDTVRGFVIPDTATQMAAFRTKQIDVTALNDVTQVQDILKTNSDTFVYRVPSATWGNVSLHYRLNKAPYNDVRVRRAISLAINREKMKKVLYDDDADLYPPIPWVWTYPEWPRQYDKLGPWYKYDVAKARQLLAEAGFPNGFKAKMTFAAATGRPAWEDAAQVLKEQLKDVGIDVELAPVESTVITKLRADGNWDDILLTSVTVAGPGYDDMVYWTHHSKGTPIQNPDRLNDPKLDEMLDKQRRMDPNDPEFKKMTLQIFDYLKDQVYRTTTTVYFRYEIQHPYAQNFASAPYNWFYGYGYYYAKKAWLGDGAPKR